MSIEDLIKKYEIRLAGTERQFDQELLKLDPSDVAHYLPSKTSILYGYKSCYGEVLKDLKLLLHENK